MTARDEILLRVRKALGLEDAAHNGGLPDALSALPPHTPLSPQQVLLDCEAQRAVLIARFEEMLTRAGGYFTVASSLQEVGDALVEIAASAAGANKAVGWHSPLLEQVGAATRLAEIDMEFITGAPNANKAAFMYQAAEARIGITAADYALADSGTLCLLAGKGQPRAASLLPPVHVAILRPEQIIRDLDDLFALLPAGDHLSSAVTLITGPSRTADIELTLVVGVHGPQQLHVILANY